MVGVQRILTDCAISVPVTFTLTFKRVRITQHLDLSEKNGLANFTHP